MKDSRFDLLLRRAIRVSALVGFFALLVVFLSGRDVPVWWITLIGGMLGIEGLAGLRGRS